MHRLTIVHLEPIKPNADHKGVVTHYGYSDDLIENLSRHLK